MYKFLIEKYLSLREKYIYHSDEGDDREDEATMADIQKKTISGVVQHVKEDYLRGCDSCTARITPYEIGKKQAAYVEILEKDGKYKFHKHVVRNDSGKFEERSVGLLPRLSWENQHIAIGAKENRLSERRVNIVNQSGFHKDTEARFVLHSFTPGYEKHLENSDPKNLLEKLRDGVRSVRAIVTTDHKGKNAKVYFKYYNANGSEYDMGNNESVSKLFNEHGKGKKVHFSSFGGRKILQNFALESEENYKRAKEIEKDLPKTLEVVPTWLLDSEQYETFKQIVSDFKNILKYISSFSYEEVENKLDGINEKLKANGIGNSLYAHNGIFTEYLKRELDDTIKGMSNSIIENYNIDKSLTAAKSMNRALEFSRLIQVNSLARKSGIQREIDDKITKIIKTTSTTRDEKISELESLSKTIENLLFGETATNRLGNGKILVRIEDEIKFHIEQVAAKEIFNKSQIEKGLREENLKLIKDLAEISNVFVRNYDFKELILDKSFKLGDTILKNLNEKNHSQIKTINKIILTAGVDPEKFHQHLLKTLQTDLDLKDGSKEQNEPYNETVYFDSSAYLQQKELIDDTFLAGSLSDGDANHGEL